MRYGYVVPFGDATDLADLAVLGEQHGWDAVFGWESLWGVSAWVALTAAACRTEMIRLGTLLTPVSRWRPWDLATTVRTLDTVSNGRVILGAGLGALHDGWTAFEADDGRAARVRRLTECLDIYAGLMKGQPFDYDGVEYQVRATDFMLPPPPVQRPHPPVWLVGAYVPGRETQPSLERAARWEGLLPQRGDNPPNGDRKAESPERLAEIVDLVRGYREAAGLPWAGYDVVKEADSFGNFTTQTTDDKTAWADAGATWWVESWWDLEGGQEGFAEMRRRITSGPPR